MVIDEGSRHRLHGKLEQVLGPQEAETLMAHLPPVGWADVATKRDLDALAQLNHAEHEALEQRLLATFRGELLRQTRTMIFAMLAATASIAGLAFAAARLT
jgi:hypothetical protein